jgi:hypothetical protein
MVEIGGAGPKAWWSGSGGEVKVGGGAVEGLVDTGVIFPRSAV